MKTKHIIYTVVLLIIIQQLQAQSLSRPGVWRKYRKEFLFQAGASGFLGDLGGRNKIGTDFSPADLKLKSTRIAFSAAYRYKLSKKMNVHTSFSYLLLSGDDKLTKEVYRNNRNLSFRSNVYELSARFEFGLSSIKNSNIYSIKKSLTNINRKAFYEIIGFIGIGGFYFNPKAKNPDTQKYTSLYKLHTEGQGLQGGPKQYKRFVVCAPVGIALHGIYKKSWSLGIEFSYRFTLTDYIDDVSTSYYDKVALREAYGSESALLSDPSKGNIVGATEPAADGTRAQRGDKNKDSYMSLQITVGKVIKSQRGRTKLRSKF